MKSPDRVEASLPGGRIAKLSATTISSAALLVLCLWNAGRTLEQYFHWPLQADDEWATLEPQLTPVREALSSIPDRHIEYRVEEADETYDISAYHRLQYWLAPNVLLRVPADNRFVIVEFWRTRQVRVLPDLTLLRDLGNGFGLYRRP